MITHLFDEFYITVNTSHDGGTTRHIATRRVDRQGRDVLPFPPQFDALASDNNDVNGIATGVDPNTPGRGWLFRLDSASDAVRVDTIADGVWNTPTELPTRMPYTGIAGSKAVGLAYHNQRLYIAFYNTNAGTRAMQIQRYHVGIGGTTIADYLTRRLEEDGPPIDFPTTALIHDIVYLAGGLAALVEEGAGNYTIRFFEFDENGALAELRQVRQEVSVGAFANHIETRADGSTGNTPGLTIDKYHNYVIDDGRGNLHYLPYAVPLVMQHPVKINVQTDENFAYYTAVDRHGKYKHQRLDAQFTEPADAIDLDLEQTAATVFDANTFANDANFTKYQHQTGRFLPRAGLFQPTTTDVADRVFKVQTHAGGRDIRQAHRAGQHVWRDGDTWSYRGSMVPPKDIAYAEAAGYPEYHFLYDDYIDIYKDPLVDEHASDELIYWGRVSIPNATQIECNHFVVHDGTYYLLDRASNRLLAFTMPNPRDAQGNIADPPPSVAPDAPKSFDLHPLNDSPDGLTRGIQGSGWYIGNLDPPALFLYGVDLQPPVWEPTEQYIFRQAAGGLINNPNGVTIDADYVSSPTTVTLSIDGTKPSWISLTGTSLGSKLTGTFPDTVENRVTIRATNDDGSAAKTFYFRKTYPPIWRTDRQYQYLLVAPYTLNLDIYSFVSWPNPNLYPIAATPLVTGALPSPFTSPSAFDQDTRQLSVVTPRSQFNQTVTFAAANSEGLTLKAFNLRSAKIFGLDYGSHRPRGAIFRINLDPTATTAVWESFANGTWQCLAAHDGHLWSINNANNQLTRIRIRGGGGNATTSRGSIGAGDWQSLVFYDGYFYALDFATGSLWRFKDDSTERTRIGRLNIENVTRQFDSLAVLDDKLYTIQNWWTSTPQQGRRRHIGPSRRRTGVQRTQFAQLYSIDPDTAQTTPVGYIEDRLQPIAKDWQCLTTVGNSLYAVDNSLDYLYSIDPANVTPQNITQITRIGRHNWEGMAVLPD